MGQLETKINAPFRLPEHAVRFAFAIDDNPVCETSRFFRDLRGGSVRLQGDTPLTAWDRVSQAGLIMAIVSRHLNHSQQAILVAKYARPVTREMDRLKRKCLLIAINLVYAEIPQSVSKDYLIDVICGWATISRQKPDSWWSDRLDIEMRTLRMWRRGRQYRGNRVLGIQSVLPMLEQRCYDVLFDPMVSAGLVDGD